MNLHSLNYGITVPVQYDKVIIDTAPYYLHSSEKKKKKNNVSYTRFTRAHQFPRAMPYHTKAASRCHSVKLSAVAEISDEDSFDFHIHNYV